MSFIQSWRWFGPEDPIKLNEIKQAGAEGVVTALHEIPVGDVWPMAKISAQKRLIKKSSLQWETVESLPVHEEIKTGGSNSKQYIDNYIESLHHLAAAGIKVVCYNFMPILDWTRTDLFHSNSDGSFALSLDRKKIVAFDNFILERARAHAQYTFEELVESRKLFEAMTPAAKELLTNNILKGLPGSELSYDIESFKCQLETYKHIDEDKLFGHFRDFIKRVIPEAQQLGIHLAVHPDDPPWPFFGLPRIVSTQSNLARILDFTDSNFHGFTFCSGSLGARSDNNLIKIIADLGNRINFVHLRNIELQPNQSFVESGHLYGSLNMTEIVRALLQEMDNRKQEGRSLAAIPMRPDHGLVLLSDIQKDNNNGYSLIGRLKGLAELRGLEMGLKRSL